MGVTGVRSFGGTSQVTSSGRDIGLRNIHGQDQFMEGREGPLTKARHAKAPFGPVKESLTKRVIQNRATVYTLTGGYYPTFTQEFNSMKTWYQNQQAGMVMINESFNERGPATIQARGNHVWYKYAADYARTRDDLPDPPGGRLNIDVEPQPDSVPDIIQPEFSLLDEIFEAYWKWVQQTGPELLNSWREILAGSIYEAGEAIIEGMGDTEGDVKDLMTEGKKQQAPEEILPALLQKLGHEGFDAETAARLMETYGDANSVDIVMLFNGMVYSKDVTQSMLMDKATHSSMSKFTTDSKNLAELDKEDGDLGPLRTDLTEHFEKSREKINHAMKVIYDAYIALGGRSGGFESLAGTTEEGGKIKGAQDYSASGSSNLRDFASDIGLFAKGTGGAAQIEGVLSNFLVKYKLTAIGSSGKDAMNQALHLIGQMFSRYSEGKPETGYENEAAVWSDIFILSESHPIAVGINWKMSRKSKYWSLKKVEEADVVIMPKHEFYMDWFMQHIMELDEEERIIAIIAANLLWGNHRLYCTHTEMVLGLTQEVGFAVTGKGYVIAGGAVVYEDQQANDAIGKFLVKTFEKHDTDVKNLQKVQQALAKAKNRGQDFHSVVQDIPDPVSYQRLSVFPQDPVSQAFYSPLIDMNEYLKSVTWAAPYVGIYYQGGQRSGIQPLLMGKK